MYWLGTKHGFPQCVDCAAQSIDSWFVWAIVALLLQSGDHASGTVIKYSATQVSAISDSGSYTYTCRPPK